MGNVFIVLTTTLILAALGMGLKASIETGNWWWAFPLLAAAVFRGIWVMGEDEDREILRRLWTRVTSWK